MPIGALWSKHNLKGFSLTEMLIVISILGIIISLAFPNYMIILERAKAREAEQNLMILYAANRRYIIDHGGQAAANLAQLDVNIRPSNYFDPPQMSGGAIYVDRNSGIYRLTIDIGSNKPVVSCTHGTDGSSGLTWCGRLPYQTIA